MIIPLFRPTTADFSKWCKTYVRYSFGLIKIYNDFPTFFEKEQYERAKKICRQYKVLLASLEKRERQLFENRIMKNKAVHFSEKEERIAFGNIFRNWQEICFPGKKYSLKTITQEPVGKKIKELRVQSGYTRQTIADILGINQVTLKAYESGARMLRLDIAYLLAQIYGETLDKILEEGSTSKKKAY